MNIYKYLIGCRITTGGTNAGVMKHVGEAIKKFSIDPNNRIVLLGIANWCTIADNHLLIKKNVRFNLNSQAVFNYMISLEYIDGQG